MKARWVDERLGFDFQANAARLFHRDVSPDRLRELENLFDSPPKVSKHSFLWYVYSAFGILVWQKDPMGQLP